MNQFHSDNFVLYFPLVSLFFIFSLGLFVLHRNKKSKINQIFFVLALISSLWEFFTFLMFVSFNKQDIIFWDRMIYLVVSFFPSFQYYFSLLLTRFTPFRKKILLFSFFASLVFALLSHTSILVDGIYYYTWGVHTLAQPGHHFYLSFFILFFILSIFNFYKHYKQVNSSIEKLRLKYYIFSFSVLNIMGAFAYLPAYEIGVYPISLMAPLSFTILMTYAIVSYRLMDIKLVLRKYAVYLVSLLITFSLIFVAKIGITRFLPEQSYWMDLVLIMTTLAVFPPLRDYFFKIANKYFFTSLYDSKKVISDLSEELSSTLEPHRICQAVEKYLTDAMHPKSIAILDYNNGRQVFDIKFNYGFKFKHGDIKINNFVINNYFVKHNVLLLDDLKNSNVPGLKTFLKEYVDRLGAEVIVPMVLKNKLVGFLMLGAKESGDAYNNEDVELLSVVGTQVAMSLENSWLYEETRTFNVKLTREVELATRDLQAANEELKRLDEAKSEFISIASHQLRTPLTVIKGYSSMMLEGSFGSMPESIESNVKKIYESNERLINLVEDLLNISRIESGRLKFDFVEDTLDTVADSVIEELQQVSKSKGLTLEYVKKPTAKVKIDKTKIRQVVMNITDNAIKYTNQGGVKVCLEQRGDMVRYSVQDTGMGISLSDMQHLFQKFSRGQDTSLIHTEGTGLGLYVGKMMIEAHGGKIWAESSGEGKGSTFIFELPVVKTS